MAELTAGKVRTDLADQPAVPPGLVFQLANEFTPPSVADTQRQSAGFHHVGGFQMLGTDYYVLTDKARGEFVQEVLTLPCNTVMNAGEFGFRSPVPHAAFLPSGQGLLRFSQLTLIAPVVFRVGFVVELLTIRRDRKVLDTDINSDSVLGRGWEVRAFAFSEDRGFVEAFMVLSNRDVDDAPRYFRAPPGLEPAEFGEFELPVTERNIAVGKLSAVTATGALLLEVRESDTLPFGFDCAEEVLVSAFEVTEGLLQRELIHFSEPLGFFRAFEQGEAFVGFSVAETFPSVLVGLDTLCEKVVVDVAD